MGLFSLTQELAIDLGTANTLIIHNGKVVVDEPSIVALDVHTGKLVAIGTQARQMHEKTNPNIKTIRPLKDGVIADFNATELMLRGMIKKVKTSGNLFAPSIRMVICIPSGSTNVEIRAVRDSAEHAGGREVYMIYEPMAAALGAGLDVEAPEGNMVIDIGGGTTEIACISLGGIVCSESINVAGDVFTNDIQSYVRQQHNIRIGERTAEAIKCSIGAALTELDEEPEDYVVTGPNMLTAHQDDPSAEGRRDRRFQRYGVDAARHDQESQDFGQSLRSLDPHGDLHSFRLDQCRDPCRAGFRRTCRGA